MEDKHQKFKRLAEKRTQAALDEIRKIGNLSNRRAYDYGEVDIKKIIKVLRDATHDLEKKFSSTSRETDEKFTL